MRSGLPLPVRAVFTALVLLCSASTLRAGVAVDGRVALRNGDFAAGLAGWTASAAPATALNASSGPAQGRTTVSFVQNGGTSVLAQSIPCGQLGLATAPSAGTLGEKLEFGAWIWLGSDVTAGQAVLELVARSGTQSTVIARSDAIAASAPRNTWFFVATRPLLAGDGRLPAATTQLDVVVRNGLVGTSHVDDPRVGRFERTLFEGLDGGFEEPRELPEHWTHAAAVRRAAEFGLSESYFGANALCFPAHVSGFARTVLPIGTSAGDAVHGMQVMAGVWMRGLPASVQNPAQDSELSLEVRALRPGEPERAGRVVARGRWSADVTGHWRHVRTSALAAVPLDAQRLVVELRKSGRGALVVDGVQAGESGAVHGLSTRHVSCNYVARFRSPSSPLATTNPSDPRGKYGTWAWLQGPYSDPGSTALRHDPSCQSAPPCLRANGRRDLAVTTLAGLDELPLAGGYDSRDPDLIAWHVQLAEAVGIDSFVFDHHGNALALQLAAQGGEDLNQRCFEQLLDICDRPEHDLKLALMYEPKVHMLGWVQGQSSLAAKKLGIRADLSDVLGRHARRRSFLRYDDRPVVFLFANRACSPDGTQCLTDADWRDILDGVRSDTGLDPFVIADEAPSTASAPFAGLSRWSLAYGSILQYPSYAAFASQAPSQPALGALSSFATLVHGIAEQWRRQDDAQRVAIPIVWPGFDDTGVAGWSGPNFPGSDGAPISVRVGARFGGLFYEATVASALATHAPWIQIATWNDWNEWTQIEPRWEAAFAQAAVSGSRPSAAATRKALSRALATQRWIERLRGASGTRRADLVGPTASYLWRAAHVPQVTRYD